MSDLPPQPAIRNNWERMEEITARIRELVNDELTRPEIPGKSASCRQNEPVYTAFFKTG